MRSKILKHTHTHPYSLRAIKCTSSHCVCIRSIHADMEISVSYPVLVQLPSHVQLFCDPLDLQLAKLVCPWDCPGKNTRQSGLPFPSPGDLPNSGIKLEFPAWQANSLPLSHLESPDIHTPKIARHGVVFQVCPCLCKKILNVIEYLWKDTQKAVNSDSILGEYEGRGPTFSLYAQLLKQKNTVILAVRIHCSSPSNIMPASLVTSTFSWHPHTSSGFNEWLISGVGMRVGSSITLFHPRTLNYSTCSIALSYWLLIILSIIPMGIWRPLVFKSKRICTKALLIIRKKETSKCLSVQNQLKIYVGTFTKEKLTKS